MKTRQPSWIAYRKAKSETALRMFCFPYAGGGASIFRSWDKHLPPAVELCPVQLPGRETRATEPAYSRIGPLIEVLAAGLRPFLDIPYVFFGYSMGALIAFELAHALSGTTVAGPRQLFLAARPGPRLPDPYPPTEKLPEKEFIQQLVRLGGTSREVLENPDLLQLVLPTLRADFALCENYTCRTNAVLDCPVTIFGGKNDPHITEEALAAWCTETRSSCKLKMFGGDHFFIHTCQSEMLREILQELSANPGLLKNSSSSLFI